MDSPWRIEFLGGLRLLQGDRVVSRFKSTKNGSLLAYLAYYPNRTHFRENVTDLFWQDIEFEAARNNFRVALNSLRRQLEPPGVMPGAVIVADRIHVSLNPLAFNTDVAEFEDKLRKEQNAETDDQRGILLREAINCYSGDLLSGWMDDWIEPERLRLSDAFLSALRRLTRILVEKKDYDNALQYAHRAVSADPLREQSHSNLMKLYVAMGRPAAALQQFKELVKVFRDELGASPSSATKELARQLAEGMDRVPTRSVGQARIETTEGAPAIAVDHPTVEVIPFRAIGNIPLQFNRFYGREDEMDRLVKILKPVDSGEVPARLVTLTGPGGSGKSRLAIEVATRLREYFHGRAWFVGLAETTDATLISDAIASAMRISPSPQQETFDQVVSALAGGPSLLILDNFEQVAEDGALVMRRLLTDVPDLILLVTSQVALGIQGENEQPLYPLDSPDELGSPTELLKWPSIKLFVDRAQSARPDFQLTPRNSEAVVELCRRLEGIPLALELAAAWSQIITPSQMLERLNQRFELLVNPRRPATERHRTLRTAIDWSFQLLTPELRECFARLSVFHGGCTTDAAAAVFPDGGASVMMHMSQLRMRSLLRSSETDFGIRFWMLESIREYADDALTDVNRTETERLYANYFAAIAHKAKSDLVGPKSAELIDILDEDHGNLRAAIDWGLIHSPSLAAEMAGGLWRFWYGKGHIVEGRRILQTCLSKCTIGSSEQMDIQIGLGRMAAVQGDDLVSVAMLQNALTIAVNLNDTQSQLSILASLTLMALEQGDISTTLFRSEERLALVRKQGSSVLTAIQLEGIAPLYRALKQFDKAEKILLESIQLREQMGDTWNQADSQMMLAEIYHTTNRIAEANHLTEKSKQLQDQVEIAVPIAYSYLQLGSLSLDQGDLPEARNLLFEALVQIRLIVGNAPLEAIALELLSITAIGQDDYDAAIDFAKRRIAISKRINDGAGYASGLTRLAEICEKQGRLSVAASILGTIDSLEVGKTESKGISRDLTMSLRIEEQYPEFKANFEIGSKLNTEEALALALTALSQ